MENTIDQSKVDAVYAAAKELNAASRGMLIVMLRCFANGQSEQSLAPKPARGRPAGAKNRKKAATGGAEVAIEG